jgi:exopolysaccharide biosynthesis polyprenyl glycosylphosphotransferase
MNSFVAPKTRPRLCHVITTPTDRYSSGLRTRMEAQIAREAGYEVDIVTGLGPTDQRLTGPQLEDVTYHRLPSLTKYIHPSQDLAALWRLYRLFKRRQYEVVHTHLAKAGVMGRLAAGLARVPVVVHDVHGPVFHPRLSRPRRWLYTVLERLAGRHTSHYIFYTEHLRAAFNAANIGWQAEKNVIYPGLNLAPFLTAGNSPPDRDRLRAAWGLKPDHLVVGYVARLVPGKGHHFAIEALGRLAPRLPQLRLMLVGGAIWPEEKKYLQGLQDLAAGLGLKDRVIFAGHQIQVIPFYQMFDLFVLPSLYEGTANAMLEALVLGLPVVAFDIAAVHEFCRDEVVLCPFAQAAGLAQGLERALALGPGPAPSPDLRRELVAKFSPAHWRQHIADFYRGLALPAPLKAAAAAGPPLGDQTGAAPPVAGEGCRRPPAALFSLIPVMEALFLIYLVLSYFCPPLRLDNLLLVLFLCLSWVLIFSYHWLGVPAIKMKPRRILLLGQNKLTERLLQILQEKQDQVYAVADHWHLSGLEPSQTLENFVQEHKIDLIVYATDSKLVPASAGSLCSLRFNEKNILDDCSFYQKITGKLPIDYIEDVGLLVHSSRGMWFPRLSAAAKRTFDLALALLLTPLATLLIILCGVAIKLNSKGPVFFIQERLGRYESPFNIIKLRTMADNAEKLSGPRWSFDNDPRITSVGRILRKTRLDEIPQLYNVIKGDMSFIGPRPIRKHFADLLAAKIPCYRLRFLTKPGLTGWAQVNCGYGSTVEGQKEKVKHDLFYLVHRSLRLDLLIVLKTIRIVVAGKGI